MAKSIRDGILEHAKAGDVEGFDPSKFALDAPKAVLKTTNTAGGAQKGVRPSEPPEENIKEFRLIADTDPHVGEAIDTIVDFLVGSGFSVQPTNIPGTGETQKENDIGDLKKLVEGSKTFEPALIEWVWHALVDGTAFMEIVVENDVFKPKVLPTERMKIQTDDKGTVTGYLMERVGGGSGRGANEDIPFDLDELAVLKFHRHPGEDFGRSIIERSQEQVNMLRDMEIDLARFISTKAYPPIIWKLGNEDRTRTQDQIDEWLEEIGTIEPESQLAVGHDVEHDVVGATSTSSSSGAMNLDYTFKHLQQRIAAALGVPAFLLNMDTSTSQGDAVTLMPAFDRRIQRYRRQIANVVRHQIFAGIMVGDGDLADFNELVPDFEFGEHSSEEERLDANMAIKLVNNNMLTFEAAARMLGIDPEVDLPDNVQDISGEEQLALIQALAGRGDEIQNPQGGHPTDSGGGTQSPGREVDTRQNPERSEDPDGRDSRPGSSVTD